MLVMVASFSSCRKKGCTDPNSLSYNPEAKKDDGSCTTPTALKKALIFKQTATWCPPCGDYGTTLSHDITSSFPNCQVIAIHGDMAMETTVGDAILDVLGGSSWPHFYAGTEDIVPQYTYSTVISNELAEAVEVSMAMEKSTNGSTINVRVQSQWLGSTSGEYFLALYVLEDGIVEPQLVYINDSTTITDNSFVHDHVLRGEASGAAFGKAITINGEGNLEEFDIPLGSSMVPANCYPVAVMWKKNGADYDFINLIK